VYVVMQDAGVMPSSHITSMRRRGSLTSEGEDVTAPSWMQLILKLYEDSRAFKDMEYKIYSQLIRT
jgi:hypothetical protein